MKFLGPTFRLGWLLLCLILLGSSLELRVQAQAVGDQVYRVVILDGQQRTDADRLKRMLESWGYTPVNIDEQNGRFRVMYGNFQTNGAAVQAQASLRTEGVSTRGIITMGRPVVAPPLAGQDHSVFVRDFSEPAQAQALKAKLEQAGYAPVMIKQVGLFYEVHVGNYTLNDATVTLGQLRQQGYTTARVSQLVPETSPAVPQPGQPMAAKPAPAAGEALSPAITQTDLWQKLSAEQKRQVLNSVMMQQELRQGNPLAERVIDIDKRLQGLDQQVKKMIDNVQKERADAEQKRQQINLLYSDSENLIRNAKFEEAILKLRTILDLDKSNEFGQRALVQRRIDMIQSRINGESYENQRGDVENKYRSLEEQAKRLAGSQSLNDLDRAIRCWDEIAQLDPKYKETANNQILSLSQRIEAIRNVEKGESELKAKQTQYLIYGACGSIALLAVLLIVVWLRGRKRHLELMRKVQEITSIRPMRELDGGNGPNLLDGNGATDSDIFAPRSPQAEGMVDPLGGLMDEPPLAPVASKPAKKGKGKVAEKALAVAPKADEDDVFGDFSGGGFSSPEPQPTTSMDDMGFDDIFGGGSSSPASKTAVAPQPEVVTAASAAANQKSDVDDIFGNMFAEDSPKAAAPVAPAPVAPPPAVESGPISFDDFMSTGHSSSDTAKSSPEADLLAIFDGSDTVAETNGKAQGEVLDHLKDSPFASMFGETSSPSATPAVQDDTEIPSIKLDVAGSTTVDLPAFSFEDLSPVSFGETANGNGGIALDFEGDTVGQTPQGWDGDYAFSALTVQADTPPKGSHQYIAFEKKEGAGKAFYTCSFPQVGGVVGIEFDLRCNDKNKFLLGFYIEKDADFQQSVHTKILRSESQTTPTIHMQGEAAPYLLGSWAHIKYVVDLNLGKLNGYIDSTHVVRDLPLQQNPGYFNTLSIRDNINTTGILLLDNIKVYKVS